MGGGGVEGSPHLKQATAPGYSKYLLQINLNPILVPAHHSMFSGAYCMCICAVLCNIITNFYFLCSVLIQRIHVTSVHILYNPVLYKKIKSINNFCRSSIANWCTSCMCVENPTTNLWIKRPKLMTTEKSLPLVIINWWQKTYLNTTFNIAFYMLTLLILRDLKMKGKMSPL
jgi:hypothetical protein